MVSDKLKYAAKVAFACKNHLQYLELMKDLPSLPTPKEEYDFVVQELGKHKQTCKGCSKARLAQIAVDPEEIKRLRDDFNQRIKD